MDLQAAARTAFAAIKTAHPSSVVAVVIAGATANGVRDTKTANAAASMMGESGVTSGTVRVDASEFSAPEKGATITVDGLNVFVTAIRTDPCGALLALEYQSQNPISGI